MAYDDHQDTPALLPCALCQVSDVGLPAFKASDLSTHGFERKRFEVAESVVDQTFDLADKAVFGVGT